MPQLVSNLRPDDTMGRFTEVSPIPGVLAPYLRSVSSSFPWLLSKQATLKSLLPNVKCCMFPSMTSNLRNTRNLCDDLRRENGNFSAV